MFPSQTSLDSSGYSTVSSSSSSSSSPRPPFFILSPLDGISVCAGGTLLASVLSAALFLSFFLVSEWKAEALTKNFFLELNPPSPPFCDGGDEKARFFMPHTHSSFLRWRSRRARAQSSLPLSTSTTELATRILGVAPMSFLRLGSSSSPSVPDPFPEPRVER